MVTRILLCVLFTAIAVAARAAPPREPDLPPLTWHTIVVAIGSDVPGDHTRALEAYEKLSPAGQRAAALGMAVLFTKLGRFAEADKLVRSLPAATRDQLGVLRLRLFLACELGDPAEAKELYRKLPGVTPTTGEGLATAWMMGALIAVLERDAADKVLPKADRERIRDKLAASPTWRPTKAFAAGYEAAQKRAIRLETFLAEWRNDDREQLLKRCEKFEAQLVETRLAAESLPQRLAEVKLAQEAAFRKIADFERGVLARTPGEPRQPPKVYLPRDPNEDKKLKGKDPELTPASEREQNIYWVAHQRWKSEALAKVPEPPEVAEARKDLPLRSREAAILATDGSRLAEKYQELQLALYTAKILAASEKPPAPEATLARPAVYQLLDFRAEAELLRERGAK